MVNNELARINNSLRLLKAYSLVMSALLMVTWFSGFTRAGAKQRFDEITAKQIVFVDSTGKVRARIGADLRKAGLAGLLFYNEEGTEAGGLMYAGRRDKEGKIDAGSIVDNGPV